MISLRKPYAHQAKELMFHANGVLNFEFEGRLIKEEDFAKQTLYLNPELLLFFPAKKNSLVPLIRFNSFFVD